MFTTTTPHNRLYQKVKWATLKDLGVANQATEMKAQVDARRPFSRNMEEHVLQQTLNI